MRFDREDLRRRLPRFETPVTADRRKIRGDHDLNPDMLPPASLREAAVLIPLVEREDGLHILLTLRTDHLAAHAGQISFPGGRTEEEDEDALDAALRETEEEIGLPREKIDIMGRLDTYVTRTGFRIVPFVGLVRPPFTLEPDPFEVAEVFEVPLGFVLGPGKPERHSRIFQGRERFFYVFPYGERFIWGATAGMLLNLREALEVD
ncbi:CoA pyrophosphatase [Inquilinus sp. CAU 1745]|uniref:CoA pyrophosphatase n=1 Tax=Inquilinus sp. CAU 1745 TaxID=3140369 RepID=UPI00325AFA90